MPSPIRFKINDLLEVRLEDNETVIYVAGSRFNICKKMLLNIPVDEVEDYDEVDSIDDVTDILKWDVQEGQEGVVYDISPEAEFFGHSSNLQAFYEYGYDTRLLHSNIAFPLLKKLSSMGDLLARKVFREEIEKRYESGNEIVKRFLEKGGYLRYLDENQLDSIGVDRIENLQLSVRFLEEHLRKYGHLLQPKTLHYIKNQIQAYKRELEIRENYPT